ncbi:hypothetical protein SGPA1_21688 [Streptomyces misionensis JCM 4497]
MSVRPAGWLDPMPAQGHRPPADPKTGTARPPETLSGAPVLD